MRDLIIKKKMTLCSVLTLCALLCQNQAAFATSTTHEDAELHFALGTILSLDGKTAQAIEQYKLTQILDPKSVSPLLHLANEYKTQGQFTLAMQACNDALKLAPQSSAARMIRAELYAITKQTEFALREYNQVLTDHPHYAEAMVYASEMLLDQRQPAQVHSLIKNFLKDNPVTVATWYYQGRAFAMQDQDQPATHAFSKAIELNPHFLQAFLARAELYEQTEQYPLAEADLRFLFDQTQDQQIGQHLAEIYLKQEKLSQAVQVLEFLKQADPDDLNSLLTLGLTYATMKQHAKAEICFKTILSKTPDSDVTHFYLANNLEEQERPNEAIDEFAQIGLDSTLFLEATQRQARLLEATKQPEKAHLVLQKGEQAFPGELALYIIDAQILLHQKKPEVAQALLEKALPRFVSEESMHLMLANVYEKCGKNDQSTQQIEEALKINPENPKALSLLSSALVAKNQRLDDAERMLKKALHLTPNDAFVQNTWGYFLMQKGNFHQAISALEKANQLLPKEPTILERLADAYYQSNLFDQALAHYTQAQQNTTEASVKLKLAQKIEALQQSLSLPKRSIASENTRSKSP
jgi:tetratricopeptide (TPR) repeat protein